MLPSEFMGLSRRERAFITAAVEERVEREKEKQREIERKTRKGRKKS